MNCVYVHNGLDAIVWYLGKRPDLTNPCVKEKDSNINRTKLSGDSLVVADLSHFEKISDDVLFFDIVWDTSKLFFHLLLIPSNHTDVEA